MKELQQYFSTEIYKKTHTSNNNVCLPCQALFAQLRSVNTV